MFDTLAAKKDTRGNSIKGGFVREEESNLFLEIKFMPEIFKNHLGDTEPPSVLGRNGSRSPTYAWSFLRERFFSKSCFKFMVSVQGCSKALEYVTVKQEQLVCSSVFLLVSHRAWQVGVPVADWAVLDSAYGIAFWCCTLQARTFRIDFVKIRFLKGSWETSHTRVLTPTKKSGPKPITWK